MRMVRMQVKYKYRPDGGLIYSYLSGIVPQSGNTIVRNDRGRITEYKIIGIEHHTKTVLDMGQEIDVLDYIDVVVEG